MVRQEEYYHVYRRLGVVNCRTPSVALAALPSHATSSGQHPHGTNHLLYHTTSCNNLTKPGRRGGNARRRSPGSSEIHPSTACNALIDMKTRQICFISYVSKTECFASSTTPHQKTRERKKGTHATVTLRINTKYASGIDMAQARRTQRHTITHDMQNITPRIRTKHGHQRRPTTEVLFPPSATRQQQQSKLAIFIMHTTPMSYKAAGHGIIFRFAHYTENAVYK